MALFRRRFALPALLFVMLVGLAFFALEVDAKKKKKGAAKKKAEKLKDDDDDEEAEEKKPRKPWNKMTKEDWDRLEREAEGPGEPYKPPEPSNEPFDPENPMAYIKGTKKGKPAMMFANLNKIKDPSTGKYRIRTKEETEEVSFKHKSLMQSGHLDATPYVIDPNKILWTVQDGSDGFEVKEFLMSQPEVEEFEWDQQKTHKSSWKPAKEL
mmetsp:Transcript_44894/g.105335  ORF Transcript_44894/g.105335 Transcript_44894/m.105335 type:complete len:211 (+) Transcript_44894:81-713(+)